MELNEAPLNARIPPELSSKILPPCWVDFPVSTARDPVFAPVDSPIPKFMCWPEITTAVVEDVVWAMSLLPLDINMLPVRSIFDLPERMNTEPPVFEVLLPPCTKIEAGTVDESPPRKPKPPPFASVA